MTSSTATAVRKWMTRRPQPDASVPAASSTAPRGKTCGGRPARGVWHGLHAVGAGHTGSGRHLRRGHRLVQLRGIGRPGCRHLGRPPASKCSGLIHRRLYCLVAAIDRRKGRHDRPLHRYCAMRVVFGAEGKIAHDRIGEPFNDRCIRGPGRRDLVLLLVTAGEKQRAGDGGQQKKCRADHAQPLAEKPSFGLSLESKGAPTCGRDALAGATRDRRCHAEREAQRQLEPLRSISRPSSAPPATPRIVPSVRSPPPAMP